MAKSKVATSKAPASKKRGGAPKTATKKKGARKPAAKKVEDKAMTSGLVVLAPAEAPVPTTAAAKVGKTTLVYWPIRGLGQPIRLLLEYTMTGFTDVRIDPGSPGESDYKQLWFGVKPDVGIDFPNLPYLLDGKNICISQSAAILRHIGRKHGMLGATPAEAARCDFLCEQMKDFDGSLTGMCYRDWANKATWVKTKLGPTAATLEAMLGTDKFFCGGNKPTIADFVIYEDLDKSRIIAPSCLKTFPGLTAFVKRFEALPAIATYLASDQYMQRPLNNPHAQFK